MITFLNIFLFCIAVGIFAVLIIFAFKAKNKHLKFEVLEIKISAKEKLITKCRGQSYSPLSGQRYSPPAKMV